MRLKMHVTKKWIKVFKRRNFKFSLNKLTNFENLDLNQVEDVEAFEEDEENEDVQVGTCQTICKFGRNGCCAAK